MIAQCRKEIEALQRQILALKQQQLNSEPHTSAVVDEDHPAREPHFFPFPGLLSSPAPREPNLDKSLVLLF